MSLFKYFWEGGRVNHYMKQFIRQDKEVIDFVEKRNYVLSVVEIFQLRDMVLRKGVESGNMTQQEAISKCGDRESNFGYSWIKSMVDEALSVELIIVNNPFNSNSNVK
jgi:hypothetical protein